MRLIDADILKINLYHNKKVVLNYDLVKCIDDTETAYDINKVVEELEELKNKDICDYLDCDVCLYYKKCGVETNQSNNLKWDKAIEIVKQSGVSDDFCEWNGELSRLVTFTRFTTNCGDNIDLQTNSELLKAFRYCPFCGKKIKVVE